MHSISTRAPTDQLKRVLTSVDGDDTNIDGRIEIGVISDSIDQVDGGVSDSQYSGDLPPGDRVRILNDGPDDSDDEGRAMAELVYDIGPQFSILFHSGSNSAADMADAMGDLQSAGADIITDDISYFSEPVFQDGQIAQAIDDVYLNHGVLEFGSAGNSNGETYYGTWSNAEGRDFHQSMPGDEALSVTLQPDETFRVYLQWTEPWGHSGVDIDLDWVPTNPC